MLKFKQFKKSDISIVLLLYDTPQEKLKNLINYKDYNIYILDQSNDHVTKKKLLELLPNIKFYKVSVNNKGFAKGINYLSKKINTKFFLCTQIDVLIKKKSINKLINPFNIYSDCILTIPNLDKKNINLNSRKKFIKVDNFTGAIFLADKLKFNKIGKFDENYFFYWEDVDLSRRILLSKNYKIYKCNNIKAFHFNSNSTKFSNKSEFIRISNFKFGEYYFDYKFNNLRIIKVLREPFKRLIYILFFLILFQKKKFYNNLFQIVGIFKFYFFLLKKFIYKF